MNGLKRDGRADPRSGPRLARNFLLCVVAFIICAGAVAQAHSANSLFAAAIGLVILLGVIMIRRFGLGLGGACSVALIGCVLAVAFFGEGSSQNGLDFSIRFAPKSVSSSAMAQRLLADSTWIGTGAGTYHDLVPIYRDPNESTGNEYPPTAAGQFSVEWGRPLFWAGVIIAIVMIVKLVPRCAKSRTGFVLSGRRCQCAGCSANLSVWQSGIDRSNNADLKRRGAWPSSCPESQPRCSID